MVVVSERIWFQEFDVFNFFPQEVSCLYNLKANQPNQTNQLKRLPSVFCLTEFLDRTAETGGEHRKWGKKGKRIGWEVEPQNTRLVIVFPDIKQNPGFR